MGRRFEWVERGEKVNGLDEQRLWCCRAMRSWRVVGDQSLATTLELIAVPAGSDWVASIFYLENRHPQSKKLRGS
jgi:hypothetical protein